MKKPGLDRTDFRILGAVQRHGPLSKTRLAEIVNLSPTPCWSRLARLKKEGLIRGYRGDIALGRIADFSQVVVTVSLARHQKSDFDRFEAHIRGLEEVSECVATGGGMDYVLKVYCRTLSDFQNLMEAMLAADLAIERYMTYIVTREIKAEPPSLAVLTGETGT